MISEVISKIANEYLEARLYQPFGGHPIANYIRNDAPRNINKSLGSLGNKYIITGSPGRGNWSEVPWIAIFNPLITESATKGYYVVYLFSAEMERVYISLNQGTTSLREEYGASARDILKDGSSIIRAKLKDKENGFELHDIALDGTSTLPKDYEVGHAIGKVYYPNRLPDEAILLQDLKNMISCYNTLFFRGGIEFSAELELEDGGDIEPTTIDEMRRYKYHRRIERDTKTSKRVKEIHGYRCQVCGFNFEENYGELGKNYIEAHHLIPLADLPEGVIVSFDPRSDFSVLCANCHRMIHRKGAPGDVAGLKGVIEAAR